MTSDPLLELCRDRPLVTPEFHPPNDYYGHASLLKRYAGLPGGRPLKVAIQHGVHLNDYIWDADLNTEMSLFLCSGEPHARAYERKTGGRKRAIAIGPLCRYVREADSTPPPERCLLAFPCHSTHRVRAVFDAHAFADQVERLGREFDRVVVCIYWRDVLDGLHRTFQARGFECVSAGHMYDFDFLPRLARIVRSASMVLTNEVGTQILIATLMGKPVLLRRTDVHYVAPLPVLAVDAPPSLEHPRVQHILRLFAEPRTEPSAEQRRLIEDLSGAAHVRSPRELRDILEEAEQDYRRGLTPARRLRNLIRRGMYYGRLVGSGGSRSDGASQ
jgi:hypothetical protein